MHSKYFLSYFIVIMELIKFFVCTDLTVQIHRHCRDRDRLITSDELDEYLLIGAEIDTTVALECRYCNENETSGDDGKIWYYQDRYLEAEEKEVVLDTFNDASHNRIYTNPSLALIIRSFETVDSGVYRCHGKDGQQMERKWNYRLEPIFRDSIDIYTGKGNVSDWENFREIYLLPVTIRFAVSKMAEISNIRNEGVTLQVISEWGPWGPCEECVRKKGFRTRKGHCRLKRLINNTITESNKLFTWNFFKKFPTLPCKSILLYQEFPIVSNAVRHLPEFILMEKCKNCKKAPKIKKKLNTFKYKKRRVLATGAHLTISCPETSMKSQVIWKKDSLELKKGTEQIRNKNSESRVVVDTFSTLYLIDVSRDEQGNYTCYVDNANMMQLSVIVVSRARLLTEAFLRHLMYLAFIFVLTSFCYCAGLIMICKQRDQFKIKTYEEIVNKEEEKQLFLEEF